MRFAPVGAALSILILAVGGAVVWLERQGKGMPDGFATANGRIEVERVTIATRHAGQISTMRVREGDEVKAGAVIATLNDREVKARLLAVRADVRRAVESVAKTKAAIAVQEAERRLAETELRRAVLLADRDVGTRAEVDRRRAAYNVADARLQAARADLGEAQAALESAKALVAQIEATAADHILTTPVDGRVEHRLANLGEVLDAGGRVATVLDLADVYMVVFLPTATSVDLPLGAEARIVLDTPPGYVFPAKVSFVAAEAQFTPKAVETAEERQKLMYRVKLSVDPAVLAANHNYVRGGLTGQAYVRLRPDQPWPNDLAPKLPPAMLAEPLHGAANRVGERGDGTR